MYQASSLATIKHGFFTRKGGVSQGDFDSLNFAFTKGDDIQNVEENRNRALNQLGMPESTLLTMNQVHGNKVIHVTEPWAFNPPNPHQADAMVTQNPDVVLGILTADCVPVLFHDPNNNIIGAAHAGWRGALKGIIEETIASLVSLGAEVEKLNVAIGPCIHQPNYEVGPEVFQECTQSRANTEKFFQETQKPTHYLFDLPGLVIQILEQSGAQNIENTNLDTYTNESDFFSCRRTFHRAEKSFGCMLSAISL